MTRTLRHTAIHTFLIVLLMACVGCGDNSRTVVTSPFFFSDTGFLQSDLGGRWSGTLSFEDHAYTVYIDVTSSGQVVGGLESDLDNIVDGFFRLLDSFDGEMELRFETDSGVVVSGLGFIQVGLSRISVLFQSTEGFSGDIDLVRTFGPGTFTLPFVQRHFDVELSGFDYIPDRVGDIAVIFSGFLEIGTMIDGVGVINGQLIILDDATGEYQMSIFLQFGEVILVQGLISLADGVLGGIQTDPGPAGLATFFP